MGRARVHVFACLLALLPFSATAADIPDGLRVGWATVDITPDEPVYLAGQFHARVSEGVMDPVTATVLALESTRGGRTAARAILVSCDLINIGDELRDGVRKRLAQAAPGIPGASVAFMATHTHTAPMTGGGWRRDAGPGEEIALSEYPYGIDLPAMNPADYVDFAADRIAGAIVRAWEARVPGGISFGLGHAVIGHNRLVAYRDGRSRMYGPMDTPDFSHLEGYEDHAVHFLFTRDRAGNLTGMAVSVSTPSQVSESAWRISADFWHEVRLEMGNRFGEGLPVLAMHGPAGDQAPRPHVHRRAEARMETLTGRSRREQIAFRLGAAAAQVESATREAIDWNPLMAHRAAEIRLPRRLIGADDVAEALREAETHRETYERLLAEIEANPETRQARRWYTDISRAWRRARRGLNVEHRFRLQQEEPEMAVEAHFLRLGEAAFATFPFEVYLDYGARIQARSPAVQTFLAQLAGPGSYLPTERSVAGGAYGAVPASTNIGPEGGRVLVEAILAGLGDTWRDPISTLDDPGELARLATREPDGQARAAALERLAGIGTRLEPGAWTFRKDPEGRGREENWPAMEDREGSWLALETPAHWSRTRLGDYLGRGWYRTVLELPGEAGGKDLLLIFEGVDEQAWVFVNGEPAGEHTVESENLPVGRLWNRPFPIRIDAGRLRPGTGNRLDILVHASLGTGGIHGPVHAFLVSD